VQEKKRINKEGELVVTSTLTRSQQCARFARSALSRWLCAVADSPRLCCGRDNLSDALEKMQGCLDRAAETLIPPEVDEEKVKQIAKQ
jgi:hypothetical protein